MLVTLSGMVTLVIPVAAKALSPMLVTPFGMVTLLLEPLYLVSVVPDI
jgi:hypothetical protein